MYRNSYILRGNLSIVIGVIRRDGYICNDPQDFKFLQRPNFGEVFEKTFWDLVNFPICFHQ